MILERRRFEVGEQPPTATLRLLWVVGLMLVPAFVFGCASESEEQPTGDDLVITTMGAKKYDGPGEGEKVGILDTERGRIVFDLFEDTAPNTVSNFCYLSGKGFYDGLIFYRVAPNLFAQAGDPKGDGTGGPEYRIPAELTDREDRRHLRGTVAMDISLQDIGTAGSRFFICLSKQPQLNGRFPVFGKVIEGDEILDSIKKGDRITSASVLLKEEYLAQRESGQ